MAGRREDKELHLVLRDPKYAREYIKFFDWGTTEPPKLWVLSFKQVIYFDRMTDDEAVIVAQALLREIEIPAAWRAAKLLEGFGLH